MLFSFDVLAVSSQAPVLDMRNQPCKSVGGDCMSAHQAHAKKNESDR